MKKYCFLICLLTLFNSCSDDEVITPPTPNNPCLFEIDIPSNYFIISDSYTQTGHIYLTDKDGNLVSESTLENGVSTCLESEDASEIDEFDITFYIKYQFDNRAQHYFNTFTSLSQTALEFTAHPDSETPADETGLVYIDETGAILENIHNSNSGSGSSSSFRTELDFSVKKIPSDVFISFQHSENGNYGYFWKEDIMTSFNDTILYQDLPILAMPTEITYPANDSLSINIYAYKTPSSTTRLDISEGRYYTGTELSTHVIPPNLFDNYLVNTVLKKDGTKYHSIEYTNSINTNYQLSNMGFEFLNESLLDFEISTAGDFEFYNLGFRYQETSTNDVVRWNFHGEDQELINIKLPQLDIASIINKSNFQLEDLKRNNTRISNINGVDNIDEYIYHVLDFSRDWGSNISDYRVEK